MQTPSLSLYIHESGGLSSVSHPIDFLAKTLRSRSGGRDINIYIYTNVVCKEVQYLMLSTDRLSGVLYKRKSDKLAAISHERLVTPLSHL